MGPRIIPMFQSAPYPHELPHNNMANMYGPGHFMYGGPSEYGGQGPDNAGSNPGADQLTKMGMDTSPVHSVGQGLTRLAAAGLGAYAQHRQDKKNATLQALRDEKKDARWKSFTESLKNYQPPESRTSGGFEIQMPDRFKIKPE